MQKRQKYTVFEGLEQTAEIHTLISLLFKSTDGTYTIFFLSMINSSTHNTLLQKSAGTTRLLHISSILLAVQ